jgi:hypothetical protein
MQGRSPTTSFCDSGFDSSALYFASSRCASAYAKAAVRQAGGRKSEVSSQMSELSESAFAPGYRLIVLSYRDE